MFVCVGMCVCVYSCVCVIACSGDALFPDKSVCAFVHSYLYLCVCVCVCHVRPCV